MACVVSKHIFGGGPYSTTHSRLLKMTGSGRRKLCEIEIKRPGRRMRLANGVMQAVLVDPYMPKTFKDLYHPGGNSLCYSIQTCHMMGFDPIYALGFTLQRGLGYHFGRTNPITRKASFYQPEAPLAWLAWYEDRYPGRVRLLPGWSGPIYDIFKTEGFDAGTRLSALCGDRPEAVRSGPGEPDPAPHHRPDEAG